MAEDKVKMFLDHPTLKELNSLRKDELLEVAKHFGVVAQSTSRKAEIREKVNQWLYDNEVWTELDVKEDESSESSVDSRNKSGNEKNTEAELRLKELELQGKKIDLEMKNLEMKMKEIEFGQSRDGSKPPSFDVSRNAKLVPKFCEDKVDEFFHHFEKLASSLEWPKTAWPTLVQCSLVGKAQTVYASLSIDDCSDYDTLKRAILRAYELVPEAYRQRFRNSRKGEGQTFVEFVHEKQVHFERWLVASGVESFQQLKDLTLLDELKSCISPEMRLYLEERGVADVKHGAILLDEYMLTHRAGSEASCGVSQSTNHKREGSLSPTAKRKRVGPCFYCKKDGHVISECSLLLKKNSKADTSNASDVLPSALVSGSRNSDSKGKVHDNFKPFLSEGFVSLTESGQRVPVTVLRDTGSVQSLLRADILPFSKDSSADSEVLVRGVGEKMIRVPLHHIHLQSEIVSGPVVVGVRPTIPVEGVTLLLGNDLAGGRVMPHVEESSDSMLHGKLDRVVEVVLEVHNPSCALTEPLSRAKDDVSGSGSLPLPADSLLSPLPENLVEGVTESVQESDHTKGGDHVDGRQECEVNPVVRAESSEQNGTECEIEKEGQVPKSSTPGCSEIHMDGTIGVNESGYVPGVKVKKSEMFDKVRHLSRGERAQMQELFRDLHELFSVSGVHAALRDVEAEGTAPVGRHPDSMDSPWKTEVLGSFVDAAAPLLHLLRKNVRFKLKLDYELCDLPREKEVT